MNEVKELLHALEGIREDVDQSWERRVWRKIDVPVTLKQALENLTKDDLVHIRRFLDLKNASQLNKAELVDLLEEAIPNHLPQIVEHMDEGPFRSLIDAAQNEGQLQADHINPSQINFWRETGLLYSGVLKDQKILVLPEDLHESVLALAENETIIRKIERNTEWVKLTKGLLYYYGTMSGSELSSRIMQHTGKTMKTFEMREYYFVLHSAIRFYNDFLSNEEGFSHHEVRNAERVIAEQNKRESVPYYHFTKQELLEAGEPGFVDRNNSYRQLVNLLEKQHELESEKADQIVNEATRAIKNGESTNQVIKRFTQHIIFENAQAASPVLHQLMEVMNNTRQWILKGHTPNEVSEQNQAENTEAEGPTKPIRRKKIGRNEPCPCGSGKKYKRCHGR